jgi:hypothetical protein
MDQIKESFAGYLNDNNVVFLEHDEWLIAAFNNQLEVFFAKNQKHYHSFPPHNSLIVNFSSFSKINYESGSQDPVVASVDTEGKLFIWRLSDLTLENSLSLGTDIAHAVFYSNNDRENMLLFISNSDKKLYQILDLDSLKTTKIPRVTKGKWRKEKNSLLVARSERDHDAIIETRGENILIGNLKNGSVIRKFTHFSPVSALAFDRTRKVLCLGDIDGKITYYYGCFSKGDKIEGVINI